MIRLKMLVLFIQFVLRELIIINKPINVIVQFNFPSTLDLNVFPVTYQSIGTMRLNNVSNVQMDNTSILPQKNVLLVQKIMFLILLRNFVKSALKKLQSKTMEFVKPVQSEVTMILIKRFALNVHKVLFMIMKI